MIEITNVEVFNFEGAFRGLRNPMNSWNKSDSYFGLNSLDYLGDNAAEVIENWIKQENKEYKNSEDYYEVFDKYEQWLLSQGVCLEDNDIYNIALLGPKDLDLAQRMIKGGNEEAKFLRQIFVSMDINAPIFWWKEASTYKISTTANSCSTMHTIHKNEITQDMFSFSNLDLTVPVSKMTHGNSDLEVQDIVDDILYDCDKLRQAYNETGDKRYWRALIEILPMGFNQKRTWTANYQVLRNIYFQRRHHKLDEWHTFCETIESLPYGKELICYEGE